MGAKVDAVLRAAGFELQDTGGGVLVWTREEGDGSELQVAADSVDYPPPTDPGAPVRMWSLHHGRPDGEETHYPTLLDALDALAEEGAEDADRCRGCGRVEEGSAGECQSCFDA